MITTHEHTEILRSLQQEIILHPEMKYRIILRAIKTEKNAELRRLIRWYNKKGLF